MKIGDIVTVKSGLGQIVGKTTDGRWIVEWVYDEIDPYSEEELFIVEEAKDESKV